MKLNRVILISHCHFHFPKPNVEGAKTCGVRRIIGSSAHVTVDLVSFLQHAYAAGHVSFIELAIWWLLASSYIFILRLLIFVCLLANPPTAALMRRFRFTSNWEILKRSLNCLRMSCKSGPFFLHHLNVNYLITHSFPPYLYCLKGMFSSHQRDFH